MSSFVAVNRPPATPQVYPTNTSEISRYHFSDLPREVFHGRVLPGAVVSVSFPHRLQPTADPHTFHFHPGSASLPPTYRVIFDAPPEDLKPPVNVTGTVSTIDTDGLVRLSNIPGTLVIRRASVRPSSP